MSFIQITKNNIEDEHICCALGAKQYASAVTEKKQWLLERMEEGLVFYRLNERAKVFIEYIPANNAWVPIHAPNYMFINCLWVSGRYKNNGYARQLLDKCIQDARNQRMDGVVHIVGKKKLPYLSEKRFFEYMGFEVVDEAEPYFQLIVLKFNDQGETPAFKERVKVNEEGIVVYYTNQCPFASGVLEELSEVAKNKGMTFTAYKLHTTEEAQNAPTVWTTFSMFINGKFITHEIMSPKKFSQLLDRGR
ncbi:GNAT family N-acetyltransferase [Bacillus sp. Hm123]|uniref:GNAT family N-acetyltransferase n=1 Tax=Bacillus sp. Hm123 TaxID=3450745 RepID=UPI003F439DEA